MVAGSCRTGDRSSHLFLDPGGQERGSGGGVQLQQVCGGQGGGYPGPGTGGDEQLSVEEASVKRVPSFSVVVVTSPLYLTCREYSFSVVFVTFPLYLPCREYSDVCI